MFDITATKALVISTARRAFFIAKSSYSFEKTNSSSWLFKMTLIALIFNEVAEHRVANSKISNMLDGETVLAM